MSGRSYLSIGDVLSLLREEFPDVTISKIRFLESQGLVDPERSPSGYRKFYDQDVARLRWVLRKQRDQFLPLRVIRERLAAAGTGVPPDDDPADAAAWGSEDAAVSVNVTAAASAAGSARANGPSVAEGDDGPGDLHPHGANGAASTPDLVDSRATPARALAGAPTAGPVARAAEPPVPKPAPARAEPTAKVSAQADAPSSGGPPSGADSLHASITGVSLTLAELCAASGLSSQAVVSLESSGLLSPMSIAGGTYYDEEALTVAKLVVAFERFGIEPRHLRLFRNAADREVGLIEQVVAPLLRQRNPEARQRAIETAAELVRLGQSLRAGLVRNELHRQLGT